MCYTILYTNRIIVETESQSIALTHVYMTVHFPGLEQTLHGNHFLNVMSWQDYFEIKMTYFAITIPNCHKSLHISISDIYILKQIDLSEIFAWQLSL
jgi:hypothetical protein